MAQRKAWFREEGKKEKFMTAVRNGASNLQAAQIAGWSLATVEGWIDHDDAIRLEVESARNFAPAVAASKDPPKVARDEKTGADRWKKLREDAARFAPGMLGFLLAVDVRVSAIPGNPPMSPFFRHAFTEFYEGNYHEFLCVGARGMGKSTNQIKVCATELLFRERHIPPMDPRWIWPFMSHNMAESNQRVQPFKSTLKAVGLGESDMVVYERKDGRSEIQFDDAKGQPVKVNIFPNTADACRGGNLAGATGDEVMHWVASKTDGLSKADDVNLVLVGALRADRSRVHIQISSVNDSPSAMLDAAKRGSTSLRYVATLGPFLGDALEGFERVAAHLDMTNRADDAVRIRKWAATLTDKSPWIPSWVGNPTHNPVEGFELLYDKLRDGQDRVGIWLQENGSCFWPLEFVEGNYFESKTIDRACLTTRVITREVDGRFPAIDTGAKKNPSALGIVERVIHEVRLGTSVRERRYQWRPLVLRQRMRKPGGLPLDLRNDVLPEFARIIIANKCIMRWWSDGWAVDQIENVGALFGIDTTFVSTSTATVDIYEPIDAALAHDPCPIALNGCENIELAVAQLRQVQRGNDGKAIVPHVGADHGEWGQVLARALAHAGIGTMPPDHKASTFRGFDDRYSSVRRGVVLR